MRAGTPEDVAYARHADVEGIETFEYAGPAKHLARHAHAEYQLTLYQGPPHRFEVAHRGVVGSRDAAVVIQADEPHTSEPANDSTLVIRGVYIDRLTMQQAAASIWRLRASVVFAEPLIDDVILISRLERAHVALATDSLEAEVLFRTALEQLVRQYATPTGPEYPLRGAAARVARARELLLDRVADSVSLRELAEVADVSRYHLIRMFRARYGMTPLAYQRNERVRLARAVLSRGGTITAAVGAAGFADQSHLGRAFVGVMGVTPGQYRRGLSHEGRPLYGGSRTGAESEVSP